jgi:hypothetical protein
MSKKSAIERMQNNLALQNILKIEPRLVPIITDAVNQKNGFEYNRVSTYIELRNKAAQLVGWSGENTQLKNCESYDVVIDTIDDLLPPDNLDQGKPIRHKPDKSGKSGNGKIFTPKMRFQILERDKYRCVVCGRGVKDGIDLHVDHVYPKSKGGLATLENGQTLCYECNIGKGARVPQTHPTLFAPDKSGAGSAAPAFISALSITAQEGESTPPAFAR